MSTQVREQVRSFIVENFLFGDVGSLPADDESLMRSGVVDSTGILELVEFLEDEIGIAVADHETLPENLDSVANIEAFVGRKLGS